MGGGGGWCGCVGVELYVVLCTRTTPKKLGQTYRFIRVWAETESLALPLLLLVAFGAVQRGTGIYFITVRVFQLQKKIQDEGVGATRGKRTHAHKPLLYV